MPQIHLLNTRNKAHDVAWRKTWGAPDDASAIVGAHLVIEALLHRYIRRKVRHPAEIDAASFRFAQALAVARSFRRNLADEAWYWDALQELNGIRNRLSHDIDPTDMVERVARLLKVTAEHIDTSVPGADQVKWKEKQLRILLMILCGVTRTLHKERLAM